MQDWKATLRRVIQHLKTAFDRSKVGTSDSSSRTGTEHFSRPSSASIVTSPPAELNLSPRQTIVSHASATGTPGKEVDLPSLPVSNNRKIGDNAHKEDRKEIQSGVTSKRAEPDSREPNFSQLIIRHKDATSARSQEWQAIGRQVSLYSSNKKGKEVCTIGLDFGTAFTKVCFQFRGSHYVVDWRLAVPACAPTLLPGVFSVKPDGSCILGDSGGSTVSGIKLAFLQTRGVATQIHLVVFLALVLRYVRAECFTEYRAAFSGFAIDWFVNVGMSTAPWQDPDTSQLYERLTLAAWNLSASAFTISLASARNAMENVESGVADALKFSPRIKSFPEFVAQIASYVHSAQRRPDLHLLVDVGAGTVDVALFHIGLNEEQDQAFLIHKSTIERLGTHVLLWYRVDASHSTETTWDEEFAGFTASVFEERLGLKSGYLRVVDDFVSDELFRKMRWLVSQTKQQRYQTSPVWRHGLPFLLCGGGRDMEVYRDALKLVNSQWKLQELQLKPPVSLTANGIGANNFHRISVAHGLTYTADNLGEIYREEQVVDIHYPCGPRHDNSDNYIDK